MNKIYISGFIADAPALKMEQGDIPHLVFSLSVQHKTRSGEARREKYRISSWYKVAMWGIDNLIKGSHVMIHGYLTQRQVFTEGALSTSTEIVAEEFLPVQSQTKEPLSRNMDNVSIQEASSEQVTD